MDQTMGAVPLLEGQEAGAVDSEDQSTEQARAVEHLVANEPVHTLGAQLSDGPGADVAQEMAQGLIDRQRLLVALGDAVEVFQDVEFQIAALVIELAAAAELAQEQHQPPPEEKATVVGHQDLPARVGQFIDPVVELGPEMPDGADQAVPQP